MSETKEQTPLIIKILSWYGILFGCSYIAYGVISIVLGILDRNYATIGSDFLISLYGIPMLAAALGFRNFQRWGWIGYACLLLLVVLIAFVSRTDSNGIIIGIVSLAALAGLMYPGVRKHYFPT
jgi:hypothetical protein